MAAPPGAGLLGRGLRSSPPPPAKVCAGPRCPPGPNRVPERELQPWRPGSLSGMSRPTGGPSTELPSLIFPIAGAAWAPFRLLGKQREVRAGIVKLLHPTDGEAGGHRPSKAEASRLFGRSGQDPRESHGESGTTAGPWIPVTQPPSRGVTEVPFKGTGQPPAPSGATPGDRRGHSSTGPATGSLRSGHSRPIPMTRGVQPRLGRGEWEL